MKKIGSLFLSLLMIFSVCGVCSAATESAVSGTSTPTEANPLYNVLSDTVWNFSAVQQQVTEDGSKTNIIDGGSGNDAYTMGGYFSEGQSFLNTTDSHVSYDETEQAAKVLIDKGTYETLNGNNVVDGTEGATVNNGSNNIYLKSYLTTDTVFALNVRFTFKAEGTAGKAALCLRNSGSGDHNEFITFDKGMISLCGTDIASYTAGEWYSFDLRVNVTEGYARLYLTPGRNANAMNGEETSTTKCYDVCFDTLRPITSGSYTAATKTGVVQILLGFVSSPTATWYVGEWYQNEMTLAPRPTLESLNSDFNGAQDSFLVTATGATTKLYQTTWTSGHVNALATVADGVAVVNSNSGGARARISRYPFRNNTAPKRRHRIDVSMGGAAGSSVAFDFGNNIYTLCYLQSATEMRLATGDLKNQGTGMNANYVSKSVVMPTDEKTPLRVKVFYDETSRTGVVGVASGKSFSCSEFSVPTSESAAFKGISLFAAGSGKSAYYDDFTWDITPSEVSLGASPAIAYENESAANLDETVTFTYSETLRETDAAVIVEANGETATPSYTLSYDDNKLLVHFAGLSPNTSYTVTAPTVTTLSGLTTESLSQSVSFTTAQNGAGAPRLSGDSISATLDMAYAEEHSASLFVVVYKADGSLKEILHAVGKSSRDKSGKISIAAPKLETGESWQAFVWSGLNSMEAYSPVGSQS